MFEMTGEAFFDAVRQAAERRLDQDHPCLLVLRAAARGNDPAATAAAQEALDALDPETVTAIMAEAHKILRESPAGILASWKPGGTRH